MPTSKLLYLSHNQIDRVWSLFVREGVIQEELLRPEIVASWERCREQGLDFDKGNHCWLSPEELAARRDRNWQVISLAKTVMETVCVMAEGICTLFCDREGFVLHVEGHRQVVPDPGFCCREEFIGTNGVGTSLFLGKPVEIKGSEHYCSFMHDYHCTAAPVRGRNGNIVGMIGVTARGRELSSNVLQVLGLGAMLVENQLQSWRQEREHQGLSRPSVGTLLFDSGFEVAVVLDSQNRVLNANTNLSKLLGMERAALLGHSFAEMVAGGADMLNLLLSGGGSLSGKFNLNTPRGVIPCCLLRRDFMDRPDGQPERVMVFTVEKAFMEKPLVKEARNQASAALVGNSRAWSHIKNLVEKAASVSSCVLISGESGSGKEVVARSIHEESAHSGPFVTVACSSIPEECFVAELFGGRSSWQEGPGKLESARGGTLFLDDVERIPLPAQSELLRFIEERGPGGVSGNDARNVRVIAATTTNLEEEAVNGHFQENLYQRLSIISIPLPPLRERKMDIPPLARYLSARACSEMGREPLELEDEVIDLLGNYHYPGNVRELKNIVETAVVITDGDTITRDSLPVWLQKGTPQEALLPTGSRQVTIKEAREASKRLIAIQERDEIIRLLELYNGNITQVARHMGLSRNTIYRKMRAYRIRA